MKEGEKRATCEVDGKVFLDGEYFSPKSDPSLDCYCMPGYAGIQRKILNSPGKISCISREKEKRK